VSTCHNPTFIAGQPRANHLAVIAPQPPACDKLGAGPCDANQGTYNETPGTAQHADSSGPSAGSGSGSSGSNSGSGSGSGSSGSGSGSGLGASGRGAGRGLSGPGGVGGLGLASGDGAAASGGTAAAGGEVLVVPTTLAADNSAGSTGALGLLALGLFLAAVGVPAFVHRRQSRQGAAS
jgi:hypothetical protein